MRKVFCRRWQTRGCAVEVRRSPRAIPCMPSATTGSVWTASTIVLSLGKPVDAHAACCGHICALRVTAAPQLQSHPEEMSEEHRTFDLRRAFCIGSSHAQAPLGSSHAPHARTDGVASCASAVFFSKTHYFHGPNPRGCIMIRPGQGRWGGRQTHARETKLDTGAATIY
jgi:hypothetical protein